MGEKTLEERIKSARGFMKNATNQIMTQTGVSPAIMDLILCETLAEMRKYEIHWKEETISEGDDRNG